jgi:hypothetical protein
MVLFPRLIGRQLLLRNGEGCIVNPLGFRCDNANQCVPGNSCVEGFCLGRESLKITLTFTADTNFTIYVTTPVGNTIGPSTTRELAVDGGFFDMDQCRYACTAGEQHVEEIVFPEFAYSGTYEAYVVNHDGRSAGEFNIRAVFEGVQVTSIYGILGSEPQEQSPTFSFSIPP